MTQARVGNTKLRSPLLTCTCGLVPHGYGKRRIGRSDHGKGKFLANIPRSLPRDQQIETDRIRTSGIDRSMPIVAEAD
jgi:hypothetical protein